MFTQLAVTFALAGAAAGLTGAGPQRVTLKGIPRDLDWKNAPAGWHTDGHELNIEAGKSEDIEGALRRAVQTGVAVRIASSTG